MGVEDWPYNRLKDPLLQGKDITLLGRRKCIETLGWCDDIWCSWGAAIGIHPAHMSFLPCKYRTLEAMAAAHGKLVKRLGEVPDAG